MKYNYTNCKGDSLQYEMVYFSSLENNRLAQLKRTLGAYRETEHVNTV